VNDPYFPRRGFAHRGRIFLFLQIETSVFLYTVTQNICQATKLEKFQIKRKGNPKSTEKRFTWLALPFPQGNPMYFVSRNEPPRGKRFDGATFTLIFFNIPE
jgi:hypothetical protein